MRHNVTRSVNIIKNMSNFNDNTFKIKNFITFDAYKILVWWGYKSNLSGLMNPMGFYNFHLTKIYLCCIISNKGAIKCRKKSDS